MDQLEAMPPLKGGDVQVFENFADLVRISVVKLQAEATTKGGHVLGLSHIILINTSCTKNHHALLRTRHRNAWKTTRRENACY